MTDPRIEQYDSVKERQLASRFALEFDFADHRAAVVRVDTRDPATIERVATAIHTEVNACGCGSFNEGSARAARAVFAALTEEQPS